MARVVGAAIIMLLYASAPAAPVQAQDINRFLDGKALLRLCDRALAGACAGYILGVADTNSIMIHWYRVPDIICLPERASDEDLVAAVVQGLRAKPEQLDLAASSLVLGALLDAFPCNEA